MMNHRKTEDRLPEWLWFFLVLPIGWIALLLWRRREAAAIRRPRYTEPDSIPLRMDVDSSPVIQPKVAAATETTPSPVSAPPAPAQEQAPAEAPKPDNLTRVEGIGPAIQRLLRENDIVTFSQLAETPVKRLSQILEEANLRQLADPETWPEQARLAAENNWDALKAMQDTLSAGRRTKD
jgi:predicted flap endonuclease-1-like 5' DNA nuclease